MRTLLTGIAVTTALAVVPCVATVACAAPSAAAGSVDMEAVLKAAQIDPQRPDRTRTPGAAASVRAVEQALRDEGLLAERWMDGHFGTETVSAYAAYQRSLGYHGLGASGLPGKASLQKLGGDRFGVRHPVVPGERTELDGKTVNTRTERMLAEAERLLGRELPLDQGSYNPGGDPTSAGTHDGGGVVDISVSGMSTGTRTEAAKALRKVGFAAWVRTPSQGDWPHHIHAAAINDPDLSTEAQHQTGDYYLGRNGLANEGPDDGPSVSPIRTWEEHQRLH